MQRLAPLLVLALGALTARTAHAEALACSEPGPYGPAAIEGVVRADSPTHGGRFFDGSEAEAPASTCDAAPSVPAPKDVDVAYPFERHTFRNRTGAKACVHVEAFFHPCDGCGDVGFHEVSAYRSFDPSRVSVGWLGSSRRMSGGLGRETFSVSVPADADFDVIVTWTGPEAPRSEPAYRIYVSGCGVSGAVDWNSLEPNNDVRRPQPPPRPRTEPAEPAVLPEDAIEPAASQDAAGGGCDATGRAPSGGPAAIATAIALALARRRRGVRTRV